MTNVQSARALLGESPEKASENLKCQLVEKVDISDYHFFGERAEVMVASLRTDRPEMNIFL